MTIRHHGKTQRIAEGPSVELIPGPNINRRVERRRREENAKMPLTREQKMMALTANEIEICSRLGMDPAIYADRSHEIDLCHRLGLDPSIHAGRSHQERGTRRPLSTEAEIHRQLGIDDREPSEVDAGRLRHALAYVAPLAAREMSDWRETSHHATEAAETLKSWKPGDSPDRLAAAAGHLIAALAKSGVQSELVDDEDNEDEGDE